MSVINKTSFKKYRKPVKISDTMKEVKKIDMITSLANEHSYKRRLLRSNWLFGGHGSEYDLDETYRIVDTEGFVSAAFTKKKTLILKEGFRLESENEEDVKYVKQRLNEIAYVTDKPFKKLIEEITNSIIHNHNAYIHLYRDKKSSSGLVRKVNGKDVSPIAGLLFLPETSVKIIEDKYKQVEGYEYHITNMFYNVFKKDEVIHLALNKKPNLNIGTPPLESVKDDILSLREIESMLEDLIYKLTIPLIHFKVGKDGTPMLRDMETGLTEVEILQMQVEMMKDASSLVTTDRVNIEMLGAENHALRLTPALDHFKNRVLVGLSISDVDLGTGTTTTGGAASVIGNALKQNIEMYQSAIADFITDYIITPILLEKESNKGKLYLTDEEKVFFMFNQTDLDLRIKEESHLINELNAKVITQNEYRLATGRRPLTEQELNKLNMIEAGAASTYNTSNVTTPTNQYSSTTIQDDLNVESYINYVYSNNKDIANALLAKNLQTAINTDNIYNISIEDCNKFVEPLTTSLTTYIIDGVPKDKATNAVRKVLYNNIIEYIQSN